MKKFVNRETELQRLEEIYGTDDPSLAIVYGRRRIGNTTLVLESIRDREHAVYYQVTRGTTEQQRTSFIHDVADVYPESLVSGTEVGRRTRRIRGRDG